MNCLEFRRIVGAQPDSAAPEIAAHAEQCAACARHRQELLRMDQLIYRALDVDVNPSAAQPQSVRRRSMQWGLAASVMLAVLIASLWLAYPRETLAEQIVEHVQHEAGSMVRTSNAVDQAMLDDILAEAGVRMKPGSALVSYAMSCPFRGSRVPHLVVQTQSGPVTVMLLPQEQSVSQPETFDEDGYRGVIMPAPRGVLAVLGHGETAEEVAAKVLDSIEYIRW